MATVYVDEESQEFEKILIDGTLDELSELKSFLFKENIRIELQKKELEELRASVIADRKRLHEESREVNQKIVVERKRLKDEELFFSKKMDILKNGFQSLEADRKALENAKKQFEAERLSFSSRAKRIESEENVSVLFQGVNNYMSLKKRYKDLLKIYHPDNMNGDNEMVLTINQIYDDLKKTYENSKVV